MRLAVVGSGPAGVATASVLLDAGYAVHIFDGGRTPDPAATALREAAAGELLANGRPTPATYRRLHRAGRRGGLTGALGGVLADLRGKPDPSRLRKRLWGSDFTFSGADESAPIDGVDIARSLAVGGLSNAWGAACYRFRNRDIDTWPIDRRELDPWYGRAEEMLGIATARPQNGTGDPYTDDDVLSNRAADGPAQDIQDLWQHHRDKLRAAGLVAGPARLAIDRTAGSATACRQCGLCLYGCPIESIWTARQALTELGRSGPKLNVRHGAIVQRVQPTADGVTLVWQKDDMTESDDFAAVFLAAGPLETARIAARSLAASEEAMPLLDSDVYVVPFRFSTGLRFADGGIALSRGMIALEPETPGASTAHLQLYHASPALLGSAGDLAMLLPHDLRNRILRRFVFGMLFFDSRESCQLEAVFRPRSSAPDVIHVSKTAPGRSRQRVRLLLQRIKRHSDTLGLSPLLGMAVGMPAGASFHLGGTLPMRGGPADRLATDKTGAIGGLPNCYAVDASVFPTMPAQNPTLSIMANAMRIAAGFAKQAQDGGSA